eukprot:1138804-Pelagomonas_calceolata.AAC.2
MSSCPWLAQLRMLCCMRLDKAGARSLWETSWSVHPLHWNASCCWLLLLLLHLFLGLTPYLLRSVLIPHLLRSATSMKASKNIFLGLNPCSLPLPNALPCLSVPSLFPLLHSLARRLSPQPLLHSLSSKFSLLPP